MSGRVVLLGLLLLPAPRLGAEDWGHARGLSLEAYGGWGRVSQGDLAVQGRFEAQWHDVNRLRSWDYNHSLDSRFSWSADGQRDLSFPPAKDASSAGIRLRYDLSRGLALSIGLDYLAQDQLTDIDRLYRISDSRPARRTFYPSPHTVQVGYPGYLVSTRAWAPALGLIAGLPLGRAAKLSFSVAGGPLLVRPRVVAESHVRTTYPTGYWSESQSLAEMTGKGIGWAVNLGGELRIGLWGPLVLTLEGAYAVRRTGRIEGSRRWERRFVDSNAAADLQTGSQSGVWQVEATRYDFAWGQYTLDSLGVRSDTPETGGRDFTLDLSGIKVQAGLSLRLTRRPLPGRR